jgi:hypothetical protein
MTTSGPVFRAAIIGTGRIGDLYDEEIVHHPDVELPPNVVHASMYTVKPVAHAGAYRTVPGYQLVAAARRGPDRLKEFGQRNGVTTAISSVSTGLDGAAALEIGLAAYHSALANSPMALPLEERRLRVINR